MRALFIITRTNEMHKHYESFSCLGHEIKTYVFSHIRQPVAGFAQGDKLDAEIYKAANEYKPDLIVYVGACNGNIPSSKLFAKIKAEVCPTVLFCSDAADTPWWDILKVYEEAGSFTLQVALDGNKEWPFHDKHLTALTPIDPARFPNPPIPHKDRKVHFGFAGNINGFAMIDGEKRGRRPLIAEMIQFGLEYRDRDREEVVDSYQKAADFMSQVCMIPNFPSTGSHMRMHVKGRVIEAGLAGCMLMERKNSPTHDWFEPGIDYVEWQEPDDVRQMIERITPEESQIFGWRLREKVMVNHSAEKFWQRILNRI